MSTTIWWHHFLWIIAASGLGFALAALFAGWFRLPRRLFLIPYVIVTGTFLTAYFFWGEINFIALLAEDWVWGLLAGGLVGAVTVANVRSQPASRQSGGGELVVDLVWFGLAYGLIDGLFLNVMPVVAVWQGLTLLDWGGSWVERLILGTVALVASLVVTLAYHVGYPEFRNRRNASLVLVGNGLITLAYLLSGNPLGAIIAHVVMHLAAVLRGPETTLQLPPHSAPRLVTRD